MIRRILLAAVPLVAFVSLDATQNLRAQPKGKSQPSTGGFGLTGGAGGSSHNVNNQVQIFQKPAGTGGSNFNFQQGQRPGGVQGLGLTAGASGSNANPRPGVNGLGLTGGAGGTNANPGGGGSAFNPRPGIPNSGPARSPGVGGNAFNPSTNLNTMNPGVQSFQSVAGGGGSTQNPRPAGFAPGAGGSSFAPGGSAFNGQQQLGVTQNFVNLNQNLFQPQNQQPLFQPQNQQPVFQPQNQQQVFNPQPQQQPSQFQPQNQNLSSQGGPTLGMPAPGSSNFNPLNPNTVPQPGSAAGAGGSAFQFGQAIERASESAGSGGSAFNGGTQNVSVNPAPQIQTFNRRNLKMRNELPFAVTVQLQYHTYVLGDPQWRPLDNGRIDLVLQPGQESYVMENGFRITADEVKFAATPADPNRKRDTKFLNEPLFLGRPTERVDGKLSYQHTLIGTHTHVFR